MNARAIPNDRVLHGLNNDNGVVRPEDQQRCSERKTHNRLIYKVSAPRRPQMNGFPSSWYKKYLINMWG
jgi:hypothetical protein